jgi:Ca2+-binding RTX toxin-like protein
VFGVENVTTAAGADIVKGNAAVNVLDTGPGADQLFGEDGDDTLRSGPGVDRVEGGRDKDRLVTTDGEADEPISCGEGSSRDPNIDPEDEIDGDVVDLLANPLGDDPGDPAECELRVFR